MEKEPFNRKNERFLPSFLLNEMEFDELDKKLEEKKEDNISTLKKR